MTGPSSASWTRAPSTAGAAPSPPDSPRGTSPHAAPALLGLFGTGEAAWSCLLVLHHALPSLSEVRVVGREPDRTRDFAAAATLRTGLRVRVSDDARTTAAGADVVATTGGHPPVRAEWLAAGALLIDQTTTAAPPPRATPATR